MMPIKPDDRSLYEADEHEWIEQQIAALQSGHLADLDQHHLAEYLHDALMADRRSLRRTFTTLLHHLLVMKLRPELGSQDRIRTILAQQRDIGLWLDEVPSINQHIEGLFAEAYSGAVEDAADEIGMPVEEFPATSPWTIEEAIKIEFASPPA